MAYKIEEPEAGYMQIGNIDSGFTPPSSSTVIPTPPMTLGTIVRGNDPTLGDGEFILLAGVASTVVGSVVTYNTTNWTTTLCAVGGNVPQPVAIAMSANTSSSTWSWYQISGVATVKKKCTVSLAAGVAVGVLSTGTIAGTASGKEIENAVVATVASNSASKPTVQVLIDRPHKQGRIT